MNTGGLFDGFADVVARMEEGLFRDGSEQLRLIGMPRSPEERAAFLLLRAEIDAALGNLDAAYRGASKVPANHHPLLVARAKRTLARVHFYRGDFKAAREQLHQATLAADRDGSAVIRAQMRLAKLEMAVRTDPLETTGADVTDLKRLVAHTGAPHLMVQLRLAVGEAEARQNSASEAQKHLCAASALLQGYPNAWLSARVELNLSIVKTLLGDLDESFDRAEAALRHVEISGHLHTKIATLINTSHLLTNRGDFYGAEANIRAAIRLSLEYPQLLTAALDSRVNLLITAGRYGEAAAAFREMTAASERLGLSRYHWDTLTESYTGARLAMAESRFHDAAALLDDAVRLAEQCHDRFWEQRIRLLRIRVGGLSGKPFDRRFDPAHPLGPKQSIETVALRNCTLAALSSPGAPQYLARAIRIADAVQDRGLAHDVALGFNAEHLQEAVTALPSNALESSAALLEVAGHPNVLAREALALIQGAGCTRAAAIIARRQDVTRVLEVRGWNERDALRAAAHSRVELVDCGTYRDEALQIIAEPHDDVDQRSTWLAIRKLVAAAVTLDRFQRDEKQRAALWPTESLDGDPEAIWVSEQSTELLRVARRIAPTTLPVLLTGESGTGKEMMARAVHLASGRAGKKLLAFNCTAVPRDMFESQLFGYRKGAFTGAETPFEGLIRSAEGGTVFLDEIADVPLEIQPKLLRFLESHEIQPLGEPNPLTVDVRIIAATNINLERLVADGRFREDLYYRLNVVRLRLPPLRERREEIPALVEHYVRKFAAQQNKGRLIVSDEALEYLLLYPWPGNVRQLANEVHRMVAFAEPDVVLTAAHLAPEIQATRKTIPASVAPGSELRISLDQPLPAAVELLERTMVESALNRTQGRLEEAARILGISRKGLFLKRRRWGMQQAQ